MALDAEEAPEGGGSRYPGGVPAQYSPADSTALARWPGRAAHARLDPGLPVPSCMDEDARLRLVFWRAGCVTKGARPVREEATRNRPLKGGAALVAYFTRRVCYLPLYIFCGRHLLAAKLRRSNIDASAGAIEEIARIVAQIRRRWPRTRILLRGDSGFAREALMAWCEANRVDFLFGLVPTIGRARV